MKISEAERVLRSIIPYRYNVSPSEVENAKETIINAVKDGYVLNRSNYVPYRHWKDDKEIRYREEEDLEFGRKLVKCPFCGRGFRFIREYYKNPNSDKEILGYYYLHEDYNIYTEENCLLDEICMPFHIPAGDARPEEGYIGEYATKWNKSLRESELNERK